MNKPAVHIRAGAFLCVSRGCRVLGHSVLSRVCGMYVRLPQKHCL